MCALAREPSCAYENPTNHSGSVPEDESEAEEDEVPGPSGDYTSVVAADNASVEEVVDDDTSAVEITERRAVKKVKVPMKAKPSVSLETTPASSTGILSTSLVLIILHIVRRRL